MGFGDLLKKLMAFALDSRSRFAYPHVELDILGMEVLEKQERVYQDKSQTCDRHSFVRNGKQFA